MFSSPETVDMSCYRAGGNEGRLQMELSCLSAVDMERSSCMILVDPIYTGSPNGEEGDRRVKKRKMT